MTTTLSVNVKTGGSAPMLAETTAITPRAACEQAARDNGWPASTKRQWAPSDPANPNGPGTLALEWGETFATYTYPPQAGWHRERGHEVEAGNWEQYCHSCSLFVPRDGGVLAPYRPHTTFDA